MASERVKSFLVMRLARIGARIEKEIDPTLGQLLLRANKHDADGNELIAAVDRLKELGHEELAERLKALVM